MRVAALYDIHGNLPALDAVLAEVRRERVDLVVVGGDVVVGAASGDAVRRLVALDLPTRFISGNCERVVLTEIAGGDITEVPEPYRDDVRRAAADLDEECRRAIASWPATCEVEIHGIGRVFFCHATARNDREMFNAATPDDEVSAMFAGVTAPLVVCGHTHVQFDRRVGALRQAQGAPSASRGGTRIVNAGSVGMPFAPPPGAHWLLLGPSVELRQTAYS